MTISYSDRFWKLLFRWKGSLWKSLYKELIGYLLIFYSINFLYRFCLTESQKKKFDAIALVFNDYTKQIPITFLLGFYVGMVVKRWWEQFNFVSWPDSLMYWVSAYIKGQSGDSRTIRRTIARYAILSAVLAWRSISIRVLKRFPTERHLVTAGLMTEEEFQLYSEQEVLRDPHKRWFIPLVWVQTIFVKCHEQKRLTHSNELRTLLDELAKYRLGFMKLFIYDWVSIPLVYTQVASIATFGYFGLCLISRQHRETAHGEDVDLYVPVFTILQFLFYVGWLKVGEDLISPFGEDDEDFEFNYLIDRHLEISYLIVDNLHNQLPPIYPDGSGLVEKASSLHKVLPHTNASASIDNHPPVSHIKGTTITEFDAQFQWQLHSTSVPKSSIVHLRQANGDLCTVQMAADAKTDSDAKLCGCLKAIFGGSNHPNNSEKCPPPQEIYFD